MADDIRENAMAGGTPARLRGLAANGNSISPTLEEVASAMPVATMEEKGMASAGQGIVEYSVIVKTCSDICFTIGQKNCQMFVAKLHKFHHPHNRMRFYPAHSVLSFPDFAVDTFLPQRFLR